MKLKEIMLKILNFLKENMSLIFFCGSLFTLDIGIRFFARTMKSFSIFTISPNLFSIAWILLFCFFVNISFKKIKNWVLSIIYIIFAIFYVTNSIYYSLWGNFFDFKDLFYVKEGLGYILDVIRQINVIQYLFLIISIVFIALSFYTKKYVKEHNKKYKYIFNGVIILSAIIVYGAAILFLGKSVPQSNWAAFSNKKNIYINFNDNKRGLMITGLYEYTFRNFAKTYLTKSLKISDNEKKEIGNYLKNNDNSKSEYNGVLKDKNVIMIMLEGIDTWLINDISMPTLNSIKNESYDFTNYYAESYTQGYTINSEFISNTGFFVTNSNSVAIYNYNNNSYPNSLVNLFKNANYKAVSMHSNYGKFYNRDLLHKGFGYEKHYDYNALNFGGKARELDAALVENNYDKMISSDKFFTYIISYSGHLPYSYEKVECKQNYDEIKNNLKSNNEEEICAFSQAKETDNFIKILLEKLKTDKLLDDTVLIFYADHYAYSASSNLLNKYKIVKYDYELKNVSFFIYSTEITPIKIDKAMGQIDVLPTIADIMGLDYIPNNYLGNSGFVDNSGFVIFKNGTWLTDEMYFSSDGRAVSLLSDFKINEDYVNLNNEKANNILKFSSMIIESDYYRIKK